MERNNRNCQNQIEICDLIDEAVNNALARRNQVLDANEALSDLSAEEAENIIGGLSTPIAIAGYKPIFPPVTIGLIATNDDFLKA